jgi:hypothetical protein
LESAVSADVVQCDGALSQDATDEEPTVAVQRILFSAHNRNAIRLRSGLQPIDPFQEKGGRGETCVQDMPLGVIVLVALGSAAKLAAEVEVLHANLRKEGLQTRCIELRGTARVRV